MAKRSIEDYCRICGLYGKMSEEHVPPKAAFNDRRYIEVKFDDTLKLGPEDIPEGPKRQGGVTFYTLCESCNNKTGGKYSRAFVDWCYGGMSILQRSGGDPGLIYAHDVYPLRVIKQIMVMFLAINSHAFRRTPIGKELARLVFNWDEKGLPDEVRFYTYFNKTGQYRYFPIATGGDWQQGTIHVLSEITYPPYGYVMTIDTEAPDSRLFDITHFARFERGEQATVRLELPLLPTYFGTIPGDYRPLEEIYEQEARTRQEEAGLIPQQEITVDDQIRVMETIQKIARLQDRYRGR